MVRAILILGLLAALGAFAAEPALAQARPPSSTPADLADGRADRTIDGIAARIEDDIITSSEVRELAAFQELVDGRAKSRGEIIRELTDQWIVRQEATATNYRQPADEEVNRAYDALAKQFGSPAAFQERAATLNLSDAVIRRLLREQLYLARFLDYRFRPAAQVDRQQIEDYYEKEFAPQLKARGEPVPPVDDVEDTIREVLIQRAINDRATKWLEDTRERLKVEIVPEGEGP
ncbi:MAG TPA: hypothetical protein VLY23_00510 [Candidatus Acidoferrum sp.]|nr:hypothetical protein [Candidatus Acidoferrum sp.]